MSKVLVVATSRKTRGGITSVVKVHSEGSQWEKFHCKWIETHIDGSSIQKLWYLITAVLKYIVLLPFYDMVHIHMGTGNSTVRRKMFFLKIANLFNKKIILHFHPATEKYLLEKENQQKLQFMFSHADLVLVLSPLWKKYLKEYLGIENNVRVLYNPCPKVTRNESVKKNQILYAGTLIDRKGYKTLLRAFGQIADRYPEWKVVFAGNGEIEKAKKIAQELKINDKVIFLGWVAGKEKENAFNQSKVYCLASWGEGFPMGVLDAWSYGLPCVVTPVGGLSDIIVDNINGLIFPVDDTLKLAEKLSLIIENQELRHSIVKETDKYVYGKFNAKTINEELYSIYNEVLKSQKKCIK